MSVRHPTTSLISQKHTSVSSLHSHCYLNLKKIPYLKHLNKMSYYGPRSGGHNRSNGDRRTGGGRSNGRGWNNRSFSSNRGYDDRRNNNNYGNYNRYQNSNQYSAPRTRDPQQQESPFTPQVADDGEREFHLFSLSVPSNRSIEKSKSCSRRRQKIGTRVPLRKRLGLSS